MSAVNWKKVLETVANPSASLQNGLQVLMVLAVAYSAAQLTWRALPAVEEGPAPVPVFDEGASQSASPAKQGSAAAQIANWHLFGKVEAAAPVKVEQPVDLPVTNLRLTLRGVIASSDAAVARAIVADSSGNENFYKIGDTLPGNAVLKEVHGDRIVIQRGSRFETLKLPKEELALASENEPPAVREPTNHLTRSASRGRAAPAPRPNEGEPMQDLGDLRNILMNDPRRLSDVVRISPKSNGGQFAGYELNPGRDASFMARYGLMPGDIVKSVNGVELDSPTKGLGLMRDMQTMETLELEVERNGVRQRFTLPMR